MAFTNIISGTIAGSGNIISADASFSSILSKFQVRYNGTGSWLECSNTSNITNKFNCSFELKLKDGETLTTMQDMFWNCSSLTSLDLSNLDTSSVINMQSVFNNCSSLTSLNVSNFNTSQVTTMNSMFFNCSSLISLDLSSFNTSQVTNMLTMFYDCIKLTSLDLSNFDTGKVTSMDRMFFNCPVSNITLLYATSSTINSLLTELGTWVARTIYYQQASLSDLTKQNNITHVFIEEPTPIAKYKFDSSLYTDYLPVFNTEFTGYRKTDVNNGDGTITRTISHDTLKPTLIRFGSTGNSTNREKSLLEVIECDTSNITNMFSMFKNCQSLTTLDLSNFDTSKATNIADMFNNCSSLTSLDLSSFDTGKVIAMNGMFSGCSSLTSLNISNFDTSQVTAMNGMFNNCSSLTSLNISNFDTSKVTNMTSMFKNCSLLTSLDLSSFNTSEVNYMGSMFNSCSSLTSLDLSNFNTSQVTDMDYMLSNCTASDIGLLYATSTTINGLLTELGTSTARNIYYTDAPLNELTVQDNITYIKYELSRAIFQYTLNKLPNGVADYIDVVNKVHVQRVGVVTVNGDNIQALDIVGTDAYRFKNENVLDVNITDGSWGSVGTDLLYAHSSVRNIRGYNKSLVLYPTNMNIALADFQAILQANPITVLYPLSTPIYTQLTEEEIAQLPLSAYKDGYINLSSDQLMPSFEFRMRTSNRYQVDMLETGCYYLNAPVGNVKLGTANVDVQQMPCIVKVDNVGTGDSGYRLSTTEGFYIESTKNDFVLFNQRLSVDGSIIVEDNVNMAITDYYNIPLLQNSSYIFNYDRTHDVNVFVGFYDNNKNHIKTDWHSKNNEIFLVPAGSKYVRLSYGMDSSIKFRLFTPITLAKLPSHRIPKSFTQGMRCGTDFGYWEGIKSARPSLFKTVNRTTWNNIEVSEIEGGSGVILNRIEITSMSLIVEDELDIATGKFTKRVGKLVLDGSSDESWNIDSRDNFVKTVFFRTSLPSKSRENYVCISNRIPYVMGWGDDFERLWIDNRDRLFVHTDKAFSVDNFRKYLASNPIIVYYPLEVPEISYPNITLPQVKTIENTALQCNILNNYLRPQVKPSHLTYPVPSLVGNRTYTVVHNRKNITGSTKPIELNLGGTVVQLNDASSKTLVKTPSTLAHSNLIFIGGESTVDHIMVLDGDWTNKPIEYFENMMGHDTDAIITIIGNGQIDDVEEQYLW